MRYIFIIIIMLVLLLSGCQYISSEDAIEIVLNDIQKIAPEIANDVEFHEIKEKDKDDNRKWQISLTATETSPPAPMFKYFIDANNGEILFQTYFQMNVDDIYHLADIQEVLENNHDADILLYNGIIYQNGEHLDWVNEETFTIHTAYDKEIVDENMATNLPKGTEIYSTLERKGFVILAKTGDEIIRYVPVFKDFGQIREYEEKVESLEENLDKANKQIEQNESLIAKKDKEIARLEEEITKQSNKQLQEKQVPTQEMANDEFSIIIGDVIALEDWDNEINLYDMLGEPISTEVRELGKGSDTYKGSIIKTVTYDGIKLTLFSPPQNGETFWVQVIEITNGRAMTPRGIKVGDSIEDLKYAYPSLSLANDGESDENNGTYVVRSQYELKFKVEDGQIMKITLTYELL